MSRNKVSAAAAVKAPIVESRPAVIELEEAEKISLSVLIESIKNKRNELANLEASQARILAKIEQRENMKQGDILADYQFDNQSLFLPKK